MKKLVLILGFLVISLGASAQEQTEVKRNDLKGPAFKNYQSWLHNAVPTKIYTVNNKKILQGPEYKNQQVGKETYAKEDLVLVETSGSKRQKLTGPAYKNYGPWSK